jgi:hypothetical protein
MSVACSPPKTGFTVGIHTVTCMATDPLGNHASSEAPVTVVDHLGSCRQRRLRECGGAPSARNALVLLEGG